MASTVETYKRGHKHGMLNRNPLIFSSTHVNTMLLFKKKKKICLLSKIVSLTNNKNYIYIYKSLSPLVLTLYDPVPTYLRVLLEGKQILD